MDVKHFEIRLLQLRGDLLSRIERMADHIHRRDGPLSADFEEQAVERENDDVVFALEDNLTAELRAVNAALARIEQGDFGSCLRCGNPIEPSRLDALPFAATCVVCKEQA